MLLEQQASSRENWCWTGFLSPLLYPGYKEWDRGLESHLLISSGFPLPALCQGAFRREMIRWLVSASSRCCSGRFLSYLETCGILRETSLTRKLKVCGLKMNRSRRAARGIPGEAGPDLGLWQLYTDGSISERSVFKMGPMQPMYILPTIVYILILLLLATT